MFIPWDIAKYKRNDSMKDFFIWYFHPQKFWLDNGLHLAWAFASLLMIALVADFAWWHGAIAGLVFGLPREIKQWPPREMPNGIPAYFDPALDLLFFGVGGALVSLVPVVWPYQKVLEIVL